MLLLASAAKIKKVIHDQEGLFWQITRSDASRYVHLDGHVIDKKRTNDAFGSLNASLIIQMNGPEKKTIRHASL